ncbi:hypothetical protein JXA48_03185 [Candidatus Woesearchaeota archaeon]|nr:hypothetical protein [Candidatus Woesearchaeota archaeon]
MFDKYRLWNFVKKELLSSNEHKLDSIISHFSHHKNIDTADLIYVKNKLYKLDFNDSNHLKEYIISLLNHNIKSHLQEKLNNDLLKKNVGSYDYDRYLNKIENNDFKWYLSPKGYSSDTKISHHDIVSMYTFVNDKLGKNYIFDGNKNHYFFYELDYETKKVVLLFHQLNIETIVNKELNILRKSDPSIPSEVSFSKDIDDIALGRISEIFQRSCAELESRLAKLRKELDSIPPGEEKRLIAEKITILHNSYNKRINLISQSTVLLNSYYHHFLRESRWRIIDVFSHSKHGLIYYFGKPISGFWIWTISKDGDFNLGNRQENVKGGYAQRLPHSTISQGKVVIGAGEVEFINGRINRFNSQSGHYYHVANPFAYNLHSKKIFLSFARKLRLKGKKQFTDKELN